MKKIFQRVTTTLLIFSSLFFSALCHAENLNDAVSHNNRGTDYYYQNQYEQALQEFNKAIQLNPIMIKRTTIADCSIIVKNNTSEPFKTTTTQFD